MISEFRIDFNSVVFGESRFVCVKHLCIYLMHTYVNETVSYLPHLSRNICILPFILFFYNGKEKSEPTVSLIFM